MTASAHPTASAAPGSPALTPPLGWNSWAGGEIRVFGDTCLDAYDQGTTDGTRVITWPCNGQAHQKWTRA
ncbi:hypothetical protein GCM10010226_67660 [Streptomyces phaeofaciens]|uniref:Ricin B lectin domain-containing protein n=1 Tax=Streptomyces phaeofaciens TaxID=68254 RepID=A0A918HLJ3_9ACTN|nr:hypothetical protein GCM10010226_67660 [Streptomyces phaeofaciens]